MKKYFGLYFMYLAYLLVLGQGCSAIDGVDHVVSVPLPNLSNAPSIKLGKISKLKLTEAPAKESLKPTESVLETPKQKTTLVKRETLELSPIKKKPLQEKEIPRLLPPIKKQYEIDLQASVEEQKEDLMTKEESEDLADSSAEDSKEKRLSIKTGITHFGFSHSSQVEVVAWEKTLEAELEGKLAALELLEERIASEANVPEVSRTDKVTSILSAQEKTSEAYNPGDPKMLAMFEQPQIDIEQVVNESRKRPSKTKLNDEPVLIDYSQGTETSEKKSIARVAQMAVSNNVTRAIRREMGPQSPAITKSLIKAGTMGIEIPKKSQQRSNDSEGKNSLGLYALEASIDDGFKGDVTNFNFVPSYDSNETFEDYGEGFITIDYSLQNSTGVLRGTLLKNYFIRTSFEVPLGSEYSKFEIPMITQDSLISYMDKNNLEGYGGYYLADLGEYLEDVELEKGNQGYENTYEHRLLLDDNFKKVKEGKEYRYVLFIGVVPGNLTVRYLGINGQETSKITFIAPDELLYDFSQLERPLELNVKTKLQNTLGRKPTELNVEPSKFINFLSGASAVQKSPGSYLLKTPWKIKGSRSYFELSYLDDSIFVGLDGNKTLELPSREFIGETLQAFNMDGLNKECLLQMNFKNNVRDFKVLGESARGPAVFDMAFLDEDGVFSAEISPISKKAFLLGNEDGVFNIKITYENGNEDYLRTYCSTSTYLLEQL